MKTEEKKQKLKSVLRGNISAVEAFLKAPCVFISTKDPNVFNADNGIKYTKDQIDKLTGTLFILPDNGRNPIEL